MINSLVFRAIFAVQYLVFFGGIIWVRTVSRVPAGSKAKQTSRRHALTSAFLSEERTHPSFVAIWPMVLLAPVWYVAFLLYIFYPGPISALSIPLPDWFRLAMAVLATVGLPFGIWGYKALGKNWVHALEPSQFMHKRKPVLVTTGPYKYTRNPIYFGAFALLLASALEAANWLVLLPVIFMVATVYRKIDGEEKMLIAKFGNKYREYMKRTPQLMPFLK